MTLPIRNLLTLTATVTPRATSETLDEMGDPTVVDGDPVDYPAWLWQTQATEDNANRTLSGETFQLALDRTAAGNVHAADKVTVSGVAYEIDGPPWEATNPRNGVVEYVLATVRRTT